MIATVSLVTDVASEIKQARRQAPRFRFGDYVRIARRELRMSQEQLAAQLGIKTATLSAWESGRNTPDDLPDVASDLEKVTGYARQWFLGWGDVIPVPAPGDSASAARDLRTGWRYRNRLMRPTRPNRNGLRAVA